MRKTPVLLAGAAVLSLAVIGAAATAHKPGHGKFFDKLDHDKDGVITRAEARAAQTRRFDRLDQNHDGTISLEEFQVVGDRYFARFDLDGDGQVTREEAAQAKRDHRKRKAD